VNLVILTDLQTQMLLVIECFTRHNILGTQSFRYSVLGSKKVQTFYHIEHNLYFYDLGYVLKWKSVPGGPTAFLHYPNTTIDLRHVLISTGQVDHRSTWNRLNQKLQGYEFSISVHHCDVKNILEIILIHLLESLEYLRHRTVRKVIDRCERDLALSIKKNGFLLTKNISVVRNTSLWSFMNSKGTFT
jgi:hypothetical protein